MTELNGAALDKWITGNYGEDQFGPQKCLFCGKYYDDLSDDEAKFWDEAGEPFCCQKCSDEFTKWEMKE